MKIKQIKHVNKNPNMPDFNGNHYRVTLENGGRVISFHYSMGYGIDHLPTIEDMKDVIRAEYFQGDYEDFVFELGDYATKSLFRNVQRFTDKIIKLFGSKELAEKFVYQEDQFWIEPPSPYIHFSQNSECSEQTEQTKPYYVKCQPDFFGRHF